MAASGTHFGPRSDFSIDPFQERRSSKHAFFNKGLISNEEAMDRFIRAWNDAMQFPGDHSKSTRVTVALEQVRCITDHISEDSKRKARAL